jgi:hypothetical protein
MGEHISKFNRKEAHMENPFDSPVLEKREEPQAGVVNQARDLLGATRSLERQAVLARKNRDWVWLTSLQGHATKIGVLLWGFTKNALLIAVSTFILELCQMILARAMELITKHKTTATPAQSQPQNSYGDPFTRHYGGTQISW